MRIKSLQQKRLSFITLTSTHTPESFTRRESLKHNHKPSPHPVSLSPLFHYCFLFTVRCFLHRPLVSGSQGGISVLMQYYSAVKSPSVNCHLIPDTPSTVQQIRLPQYSPKRSLTGSPCLCL